MGAAVGERVQLAVDPVEPDASAADLDVPYDALVRGLNAQPRFGKCCRALLGWAGEGTRPYAFRLDSSQPEPIKLVGTHG